MSPLNRISKRGIRIPNNKLSQNKIIKKCIEYNTLPNSFPVDINEHVSFFATQGPL